MTCKKYRAYLMGIIVLAVICGMFICLKYGKEKQIPTDGVLVRQMEIWEDGEAMV